MPNAFAKTFASRAAHAALPVVLWRTPLALLVVVLFVVIIGHGAGIA